MQHWHDGLTIDNPNQLKLPFPERHGLRFRPNWCTRCQSIHFAAEDAARCQQANLQREQL
jgi:hypothetical protein